MESPIVKTFIGRHIDLSKVVSITDAVLIKGDGEREYFVGFEIDIQLLNRPIKYKRKITYDEWEYREVDSIFESSPVFELVKAKNSEKPLAVVRLQSQINDLVFQWKEVLKGGGVNA